MGSRLKMQKGKRSAKQKRVDAMSRVELLRLLLNQAQFNGFEFRHWFQTQIRPVWPGAEQALVVLASEGRYFALLFSAEFAQCFWRTGALISFSVPSVTYPRVNSRGEVVQVTRKPFTRRTIKPDVWKYHLRQMASSGDPVAYLCRFLPSQDQALVNRQEDLRTAAHA
jgi:hypothetical protein